MTNFAGDWKNFILDRYLWFHVHLKKNVFQEFLYDRLTQKGFENQS